MPISVGNSPFIRFSGALRARFSGATPPTLPVPDKVRDKLKEMAKKYGLNEADTLAHGEEVYRTVKSYPPEKQPTEAGILNILDNEFSPDGEFQVTWPKGEGGTRW